MPARQLPSRTHHALIAATLLLGVSAPSSAQGRGMPIFFESTYGYHARLGAQLARGGELDGTSIVAEGSYHFGVGRFRRIAVSAAGGVWDPPTGAARGQFSVSTQIRLDPAPGPGQVRSFTVRAILGVAGIDDGDKLRWSVPFGVGAGYAFRWPVVHIEPWIAPQMIWAERTESGKGELKPAFSAGITVGASKIFGLRLGTQCCVGGLGWAAGVSKWF